jgi:two-component sensor histidine kinase
MDGYEVEQDFSVIGRRTMVLNARTVFYEKHDQALILLAIEDITERRTAERGLAELLEQKETLLQEMQHRVANSLQIIASVLMQSARRVQSEETRLHLRDAHSRVMSIATLQKQLAVTQLESVKLGTYFADLCRSISASMIDDRKRLTLEAVVDDTSTNSDVSVSMGLIVTELVINAIKHAFPDQATGGKINVSFAEDEQGWLLSVSDNGIGMPVGDKRGKPGLGTGIVEALSTQLDARVSVVEASPGTRVEVRHART